MRVHSYFAFLLFVCAATTLCNCTSILRVATAERRPLTFVGHISYGAAAVAANEVRVPVSFAGGEWNQNSGISLYSIQARVHGREIELGVSTALSGGNPAPCEFRLRKISSGTYSTFYRDPDGSRHAIGPLEIPDIGKTGL